MLEHVCDKELRELRTEIRRLRTAGDALYEACQNSWQAGYLDEATEALDHWWGITHSDGTAAHD